MSLIISLNCMYHRFLPYLRALLPIELDLGLVES